MAKQGAERGNAMWQLALDIGRRSLESLSGDGNAPKAKTTRKAKAAPKAKTTRKAKAAPKARKAAAPKRSAQGREADRSQGQGASREATVCRAALTIPGWPRN